MRKISFLSICFAVIALLCANFVTASEQFSIGEKSERLYADAGEHEKGEEYEHTYKHEAGNPHMKSETETEKTEKTSEHEGQKEAEKESSQKEKKHYTDFDMR